MIQRLMVVVVAVFVLFSLSPDAQCKIIRVKTTGNDAYSGSSWTLAKKTIQAGLNAASGTTNDQVWVAKGTYYECIILKSEVALYGGFTGNETSLSQRNHKTNLTYLNGSQAMWPPVVSSPSGATATTRIDGFSISGGALRGGIDCNNSSPTIANNNISGNTGMNGGGISCWNSSALITGNIIAYNYGGFETELGGYAGGIYCAGSSPTITNNILVRNETIYAIRCEGTGSALIAGNIVVRNSGGIYVDGSSANVTNNTIARNTGVGINGGTNVYNNIVAFNGYGIQTGGTCDNNDVFGNTTNYQGCNPGSADISADPSFISEDNDDYHIGIFSPCINAGWNDAPSLPLTDVDGEQRTQYHTVDIGADECWLKASTLGDAKRAVDGVMVDISELSVTRNFAPAVFYVESTDRSSGIQVDNVRGFSVVEGMKTHVVGVITRSSTEERCIDPILVEQSDPWTVQPLLMNNRSIGGKALGLQSGVYGWYRYEWRESDGLNNIGLLIKTFGRITAVGNGYFYVDDGSNLDDGTGNKGVKVYGTVPVDGGKDHVRWLVAVTGISSCEKPGIDAIRVIRTRGTEDVVILN